MQGNLGGREVHQQRQHADNFLCLARRPNCEIDYCGILEVQRVFTVKQQLTTVVQPSSGHNSTAVVTAIRGIRKGEDCCRIYALPSA